MCLLSFLIFLFLLLLTNMKRENEICRKCCRQMIVQILLLKNILSLLLKLRVKDKLEFY